MTNPENKLLEGHFREQERYSFENFVKRFSSEISQERARILIRKLKEHGVLKQVKNKEEKDLSELVEEDVSMESVENCDEEKYFVFTFVGILWVGSCLIKCYPKYFTEKLENKDACKQELTTVFKVLRKYNRGADKEIVHLYNGSEEKSFNFLAVMLYLLNDYYENGLYPNEKELMETNGTGDILWDRTINDTFAILQNGRPYYMELKTRRRALDEMDYFRRLHQCILSECSKELEDKGILELFDLTSTEESDEGLDDFGDDDYICYRIENELNVQFNTRKRLLLKTMYAYVKKNASMQTEDNFSLFGTNAFHVVWEKVCKEVLQDRFMARKKNLPAEIQAQMGEADNLASYIERPKWNLNNQSDTKNRDTLIPDLITISESEKLFAIFDAKYYKVKVEDEKISGQPGIESVSKQFMYEHAYKKIVPEDWIKYNAFLFPVLDESELFERKGKVWMDMFCGEPLNLQPIQIIFVNPKKAYQKYLQNENGVSDMLTVINSQNT